MEGLIVINALKFNKCDRTLILSSPLQNKGLLNPKSNMEICTLSHSIVTGCLRHVPSVLWEATQHPVGTKQFPKPKLTYSEQAQRSSANIQHLHEVFAPPGSRDIKIKFLPTISPKHTHLHYEWMVHTKLKLPAAWHPTDPKPSAA